MIKAVIFDMDGVLINTEPLHFQCWKEAWKENGIEITYDVYKKCIGSTSEFLMKLIRESYTDQFQEEVVKNRFAVLKRDYIERHGYPTIPGVPEIIKGLHQSGLLLAVASSSSLVQIQNTLEALNVRNYFQCLISGEMVKHPKPAPDIFLLAAESLNLKPEECVVIEDSTNGCNAAKNAGIRCIGYQNPDSGEQNLEHAVARISSWQQWSAEALIGLL